MSVAREARSEQRRKVNFKTFRAAFILAFGECQPNGSDFFYGVQGVLAEVPQEDAGKYKELANAWGLPVADFTEGIVFQGRKWAQFSYDSSAFHRLPEMRGSVVRDRG